MDRENPRKVIYPYRAYGLTLSCNTPVSALRQEHTDLEKYDIVVSLGPETDWVRQARRLPSRLEHPRPGEVERDDSPFMLTSFGTEEFFQLAYGNEALFFVDGAAERIWGTCLPPLTNEDVATYLLGPVMGFVLRRRGVLALHASAVCIGGQAVALCGESQAGKSTIAAALARVAAVDIQLGKVFSAPGWRECEIRRATSRGERGLPLGSASCRGRCASDRNNEFP